MHLLAASIFERWPSPAYLFFHDTLDGVMSAGRMNTRASGKRSQERIHGVNQILPGRFHGLLKSCQLGVIGIFKVRDAALKLRKARADVFEFPVVLELDADLLLGEPALKQRHAGGQILDFPDDLIQIRFLQLHDCRPPPDGKIRKGEEIPVEEEKAVDSPKRGWANGLKTGLDECFSERVGAVKTQWRGENSVVTASWIVQLKLRS